MQIDRNFDERALGENLFWLQIMGDHGRFILNELAPSETINIQKAVYFIKNFDKLLEKARGQLSSEDIKDLTKQALEYAKEIREFKLTLINEHIAGKIKLGLTPTFINHMVNEVEEYIKVLEGIQDNKIPVFHALHHHKLWLPDASGHSLAIVCGLDSTERLLRDTAMEYAMRFEDLYIKADEYEGYTRTGVKDFPALTRLNRLVNTKITMFMDFLNEIKQMRLDKIALGTLLPLMADHMYREECYYMKKLSQVTRVPSPECDPAEPREE